MRSGTRRLTIFLAEVGASVRGPRDGTSCPSFQLLPPSTETLCTPRLNFLVVNADAGVRMKREGGVHVQRLLPHVPLCKVGVGESGALPADTLRL